MKSGKNRHDGVEILIAEDSPTQAERLRYLLEQHGCVVAIAANGKEALAAARRRKPDLIISDVVMPEMDGYGLCKAIKSDEKLKNIPFVLVTMLSDPQDVIRGLECGADNFIRKPYDERYLLSRIDRLLMNLELRKNQKMQMGVEIELGGRKHFVTAERQQILDLLITTYEQAVEVNSALKQREKELAHFNQVLNTLYLIAEGLNRAAGEQEVAELVLERALELPGIQAGWISLREGESGFRLAAARNLPPALEAPGAMEGDCTCRRRLVSGELDSVTNILECERLAEAKGDTRGLRYHASVPLWLGDRTLGVMNLVGPQKGLFNDEELRVLYSVGNQVAVALERARLREHLEELVEERTAKLEAEIVERKRIEKEQARLVAIIEATPDFVATGDLDGHALYLNQAGLRMLGFGPGQDVSELRVGEGHPDWALKLVRETGIPHAIEHGTWSGETAFLRPDGGEIPTSQVIIAHKGESGSVEYLSTIARDITLRKEHENRITRLNRVYAILSGINTTIVRTRSRQELFDEACRIAVEQGKFRFAWIGTFDADTEQVTPVARAGVDEGYIDNIRLTARENVPDSCALVARALRGKTVVLCNDIDTNPQMARWREEALRRGYRSLVVLPLQVEEKVLGVLLLYASEKHFFDTEEMRLLTEVAGDISFALDNFKREAVRKRAEQALAESEARFRSLTEMSSDFYWETDAEHRFTQGNSTANLNVQSVWRTQIGKRRWETPYVSPDEAGWQAHRAVLDAHRPFREFELSRLDTDGTEHHLSVSGDPIFDESGAFMGYRGVGTDITERKRAELALRAAEGQFRGLVEQSIAGTYIIQDGRFAYVNRRCAEIFGYGSADEMIGRDASSLVAENERNTVAENVRRLSKGGTASVSYEFTGLRKDGSTIDVGVHGARAIHRGRPAVIGLIQDISEKKRAEEQIRRYVAQLETAFMSTVRVATTLSEMRDPYTTGHERRVAEIAVAIGVELGFDARRQEGLRVAGYLHDVGKITIPSEILSKPGRLTPVELDLIRGHAQASYDVLKAVEFPWPVAEVALQHHERIDGSGYPQGLKGEAILLEARIMAVADVVEAMSSHRPYRPGLGIDKALAEIGRGRATAYDAEVADACLRLFREKGYAVPA